VSKALASAVGQQAGETLLHFLSTQLLPLHHQLRL
jgi:hypothetical protein